MAFPSPFHKLLPRLNSAAAATVWLPFLLLLLICLPPTQAAYPLLWISPDATQDHVDLFHASWKEAIVLARAAALTFQGPCDPVYQRYFEDDGADFVKHIFRRIANIPLDARYTSASAPILLFNDADVLGMSPRFARMTLALEAPPSTPAALADWCSRPGQGGVLQFDGAVETATVVMCERLFDVFPLASTILHPPRGPDGAAPETFGCEGLGYQDSVLMVFPGSIILHELIHWAWLLQDTPQWADFINLDRNGLRAIADFKGIDPPDGYGPYNAKRLKDRALSEPGVNWFYPTLNNADNYMWYALSKWWGFACGKQFGPQLAPGTVNVVQEPDTDTDTDTDGTGRGASI